MGRVVEFQRNKVLRRRRTGGGGVVVDLILQAGPVDDQMKMGGKRAPSLPVADRARHHAKPLGDSLVASKRLDHLVNRVSSIACHKPHYSRFVNYVKIPSREVPKRLDRGMMKVMEPALKSAQSQRDLRSQQAIAKRLIVTRDALGLRPSEVADRAGLKRNAYSQYESGTRRISLEAAWALVDTFDLDLNWIYGGDMSRLPYDLANKISKYIKAA